MDISGLSREKVRRPPEIMEYGACSLSRFYQADVLLDPNLEDIVGTKSVATLFAEVGTFSVIAITLHYNFALLYNAFILCRIVITSNSYSSENLEPIIALYSYRSDIIDKCYCIYFLSLLGKIAFNSIYNKIIFCYLRQKIIRRVFAIVWKRKFLFWLQKQSRGEH